MTAQSIASVSKSPSATVAASTMRTQGDAIIQVQDLAKIFDPDIRAVDGISFAVRRGEIFGFLGPNGAGKTTTIKVITTLIKKTSGRAVVDGIDVDKDPAAIRKIIGYAAQEVGIDDELTGRENLRLQCALYHLPKAERDERIAELLKAIDLEDAADRRAGTYSGGMRKRLDLAMALIPHPKVLFLDEPTTGLDPQNRAAVWEYIRGLNEQGMTIFLTTQYMEEADRLADRLCIIDHGHIMAEGTPASLKGSIGADVDYYMPTMNGLELLARLRDRGISIPAMVITSHPNRKLRERIAAAGVPLIEKPFLGTVLSDRIREALGYDCR